MGLGILYFMKSMVELTSLHRSLCLLNESRLIEIEVRADYTDTSVGGVGLLKIITELGTF